MGSNIILWRGLIVLVILNREKIRRQHCPFTQTFDTTSPLWQNLVARRASAQYTSFRNVESGRKCPKGVKLRRKCQPLIRSAFSPITDINLGKIVFALLTSALLPIADVDQTWPELPFIAKSGHCANIDTARIAS